tara:strand:+ start:3409 stop:3720 length:312 start_codon:yes stop_codon:yes gene_type:complete
MSEEQETATEGTTIKSRISRIANIAAIGVAAVTAVLVSLGIWDEAQGDDVSADADCVARCLSGYPEGDPGFMGSNAEAMLGAPVTDHDVEPAEDAEEVDEVDP